MRSSYSAHWRASVSANVSAAVRARKAASRYLRSMATRRFCSSLSDRTSASAICATSVLRRARSASVSRAVRGGELLTIGFDLTQHAVEFLDHLGRAGNLLRQLVQVGGGEFAALHVGPRVARALPASREDLERFGEIGGAGAETHGATGGAAGAAAEVWA